jgi:4-hydroxybenzoate polyprenyltransferase
VIRIRIRTTARLVVLLCRPPVLLLLGLFAALGMAQAGAHGLGGTSARVLLVVAGFLVASVAVNDLADEAVDRVNLSDVGSRPLVAGGARRSDLPLVAGVGAGVSLLAAATLGLDVLAVVLAGMALSAAYSLPPTRLSARGAVASLLLPAGYVAVPFLTGLWSVRATTALTGRDALLLAGLYVGFIGRILLKDFRDVRGDALFGKRTFLVRYGRRRTCGISAGMWVLGSASVAGVRGAGAALLAAQLVWVVVALALLRALAVDGGARRDERLISAIAIVGRGMVVTTIAHLGMLDARVPAPFAVLGVAALVGLILGQVGTMVRFGPTTRLRVPAAWARASSSPTSGPATEDEQMRGPAEQARLGFDAPDGPEQRLLPRAAVEPLVDVGERRRRPFDGHERFDVEAGRGDLFGELVGAVEVGGGEPARSAIGVGVDARRDVALDDRLERGVGEEPATQAVEGGGES